MEFNFKAETSLPIFDTHAHYYDRRFEDEIDGGEDSVLAVLLGGNVKYIVNAGTNIESSKVAIAMAEKYEGVYATAGIHPGDIDESLDIDEVMAQLRVLLSHEKVRALGEIGLDYHYEEPSREVQKLWFRRQLMLARELNMPVVIHDREAHGDVMEILWEYPEVTGEFHSFSGSAEMARQLVDRGWYISFSGVITFKNAARLAEVVPTVPLDRVMIETDAPYLAPVPYRGKMNHSGLMEYTAVRAAELYGITPEEFAEHAVENAKRFFGIE